ncbi:MAG TPA: NAD(P)-dependent oxidoreductase [Puia sp.]|nr:NAD(P)-dependent oxidoreductase [Puia sp.]
MATKKIGWIGLGNMGVPMARNLVRAGYAVTVYNRTPAKTAVLVEAGAELAVSPQALWEAVDIVITMVSDDAALREIHGGEKGLLAGAQAGKMVIDMSTVSPVTSRELAGQLAAKGVDYLDAPVAGSVKPAELGQLVIMVGGKKECYEAALPIFEKLGKVSFLMGEQGAGNAAKLAVNTLLAFNMQGLAESVLFAGEKGIRPEAMLAVIGESALANGVTKMKTANIAEENYQAAFALRHLAKDLRLALGQGLHTPGGIALHDSFQQALVNGWGEKDISAIFPFLKGEKA